MPRQQKKSKTTFLPIRGDYINRLTCHYAIDQIENGWLVQITEKFSKRPNKEYDGSYAWNKAFHTESFEEAYDIIMNHRSELVKEKLIEDEERKAKDEVPF